MQRRWDSQPLPGLLWHHRQRVTSIQLVVGKSLESPTGLWRQRWGGGLSFFWECSVWWAVTFFNFQPESRFFLGLLVLALWCCWVAGFSRPSLKGKKKTQGTQPCAMSQLPIYPVSPLSSQHLPVLYLFCTSCPVFLAVLRGRKRKSTPAPSFLQYKARDHLVRLKLYVCLIWKRKQGSLALQHLDELQVWWTCEDSEEGALGEHGCSTPPPHAWLFLTYIFLQ